MVDNDANCAARAEASRLGLDPVAVVMIGTGIGMGFWTAGDVFRGGGFAGEAGHFPVEKDGGSCRCGRRGCWETRVSGWRLEELGNDDSAIHEMGVWLGHGLATLITLLDPEVIVLGGGLIDDCGARLIDPAVAELERRSDLYRPAPVVMRSEHGLWSGAVGAAMLASL
jgi:glucokinase